ncbi:MAG: hypothetical protein K2K35_06830 [Lachnospiraceae bacterium]|nr:hypothetical protein [Lachnospiraceae bacterium]
MPQAIAETVFDVFYLGFVLTAGMVMLLKGNSTLVKKSGLMAVLLGTGDSFHLVLRVYALWTDGLEANAAALGTGKFITSITMTVFYLILYYIWRGWYKVQDRKSLSITMWGLSVIRIAFCLLPQNKWLLYRQPLLFGILRNIPFAIMGIIIIVIFAQEGRKTESNIFKFMPLAVGLSFGFYLPVVLFSGTVPVIGMLMIPKTIAYVWVVLMCWQLYRQPQKQVQPA